MFIRKISIRSRFFIFTICSLLLWLIIGFILFSFLSSYRHRYNLSSQIQSITFQSGQIRNYVTEFLYYDIHINAFYETGRSPGLENFEQAYTNTCNQIRDLKADHILKKNPVIILKLDNLYEQLITSDKLLHSLASKIKERGFNGYGLQGYVIPLLNEFLGILNPSGQQNLLSSAHNLEISLPEYFENPSHAAGKQLADKQAEIMALLQTWISAPASTAGATDKTRAISLYNNLSRHITDIISIDEEIGFSQFEGLRNEIRYTNEVFTENASALNSIFNLYLSSYGRKKGYMLALLILLSAAIFISSVIILTRSVQIPLNRVISFINALVAGRLPEKLQDNGQDEITEIAHLLNNFSQNLREKSRFAGEIGRKQDALSLPLLSDDDILGNALIEMGKDLQAARIEDQKHRDESEKRRWINEGLAKFEEILRIHSHHLETLSDVIIQNLVKYLNASMGGLYLTDPEANDKLELTAAFAFDRKKHLNETFSVGEGLVGTCAIEKQKIFLTDIPEDYIKVTSGLGNTKPRCLLLNPLKLEDQVLGVIEIASMNILKEHELFFIEKIGESIASAISTVRINMKTARLLEQSQKQAREMAQQEEKMRQHMEELQVTQEESARRESEITGILNAIHNSSLVAEYNMNEELININDKFLILLETYRDHIIGKKCHEVLGLSRHTDSYKDFWHQLRNGMTVSNVEKIKLVTGNEIWLRQTYTPIPDKDGVPFKVLNIAIDITETLRQQESIEKQAAEISRTNMEMQSFSNAVDQALIKCVYSPAGQILEVNDNFEKATGFSRKEMIGKNNRIFLQRSEKEQFEKIWNDVVKDKPYSGVIRRTKPTGEEIWIMSTFTPVKDEDGVLFKVYYLGQDITERKLKYQLLEEANKEIERLRKLAEK